MADASETLTREDALGYLRRFPEQGFFGTATSFASVLAGNAVVLHFVLDGRLRAAHLIALVMAETLVLTVIAWAQHRFVPRRDWSEQPKPLRERVGVFAFLLVWLAGAYGITLVMLGGVADFAALLRSSDAWTEAGLQWPLLVTLVLGLAHALGDDAHYRRHGGPFLSTVAHDSIARYLTLIFGGIPFAMPFFVVVIGGFKAIEFLMRRARVAPGQSVLGALAMIAVGYGGFALVGLLIANGVAGWAIGYILAKLAAELAVAAIPLVMAKVARDGP